MEVNITTAILKFDQRGVVVYEEKVGRKLRVVLCVALLVVGAGVALRRKYSSESRGFQLPS